MRGRGWRLCPLAAVGSLVAALLAAWLSHPPPAGTGAARPGPRRVAARTIAIDGLRPGTLAIDEGTGRALVVSNNAGLTAGTLTMLDIASGATIYTAAIPVDAVAIELDEAAGRAFIIYGDFARTLVLDTATGRVLGALAGSAGAWASTLDARRHRLYITTSSGAAAFDARTGRRLWAAPGGGDVLLLDARTNRLLECWSIVPPADGPVASVFDAATGRRLLSPPALSGLLRQDTRRGGVFGLVGYPGGRSAVLAFDERTVRVVRETKLAFDAVAMAVDGVAGAVYVAGSGGAGNLLLLDARTGGVRRSLWVGAQPPGIFGGSPFNRARAVVADERRGRVYVTTGGDRPGLLSILDARSGRVLRTVAVGAGPGALALDRRDGYLLIANTNAGGSSSLSVVDVAS